MATVRKALKNIASGKGPQKLRPPTNFESDDSAEIELVSLLPNAIPTQYPPLVLVHVLLLSAALVLLPQTPLPDLPLPPPARGLDKPQHPFLVPITARPVLTLAWACLGATLLVPWWAGSLRRWVHDGTLGSRNIQLRLQGDPHKQRDIWNAFVFTGYTALVLHAVIILFGAPFVHVSPLYLHRLPPAYALGPPRLGLPLLSASASNTILQNDLWIRIFVERKQVSFLLLRLVPRKPAERCLLYPTYGAFLGAWFGVIPIGLDWDRPWQAYPLTPAAGASLGYMIGALLAFGVNVILFFADADRLGPSGGAGKGDLKSTRKDREQKKPLVKEN
ncbi:GPI biosynthesis protein family Pig-F-domain-containing protein [Lactarius hengduanensis]|nr:GPI biosynthesis protein family Pig-F-domain-containing protein [Lactarius hengduanensis]